MNSFKNLRLMLPLVLYLNAVTPKKLDVGLKAVTTAIDIAGTAIAVVDFLDEGDSGATTEDLDKLRDDIIQKVSDLIKESETRITLVIDLQQKVERLTTIKTAISSALEDLDRYLEAESADDQTYSKRIFIERFDEHDTILLIRELSSLLTATVPDLSKSMASLILETTNCNMTSIMEFETFYGNLVSQAVTLDYSYTKIKALPLDIVEADWDDRLSDIQNAFDSIERECVHGFSASVTEEVKQSISLEALQRNSNERYNWKWNDVYQYEPRDIYSHTWHYFVSLKDSNFLFWNGPTSSSNRIIVFEDKNTSVLNWEKAVVQCQLLANVSEFQRFTGGKKDAKLLGEMVGTFINDINFVYKGIIVLYVPDIVDLIFDDQNSPAAGVYVPFDGTTGFRVYVYPETWNNATSNEYQYNENELAENCGYGKTNTYLSIAMLYFAIAVVF